MMRPLRAYNFLLLIFIFNLFCENSQEEKILSEMELKIKDMSSESLIANEKATKALEESLAILNLKKENLSKKKEDLENENKLVIDPKIKISLEAEIRKIEKQISLLDEEFKNENYSTFRAKYLNDLLKAYLNNFDAIKLKKKIIDEYNLKIKEIEEMIFNFKESDGNKENYINLVKDKEEALREIKIKIKDLSERYKVKYYEYLEEKFRSSKKNYEDYIGKLKGDIEKVEREITRTKKSKSKIIEIAEEIKKIEEEIEKKGNALEVNIKLNLNNDDFIESKKKELNNFKEESQRKILEKKQEIINLQAEVEKGKALSDIIKSKKELLIKTEERFKKDLQEKERVLNRHKAEKNNQYLEEKKKYEILKEKYEKEIAEMKEKIKNGVEFSKKKKEYLEKLKNLNEAVLNLKLDFDKKVLDIKNEITDKGKMNLDIFKKILKEYSKKFEYEIIFNRKKFLASAVILGFSFYGFYKFYKSISDYFSTNSKEVDYSV